MDYYSFASTCFETLTREDRAGLERITSACGSLSGWLEAVWDVGIRLGEHGSVVGFADPWSYIPQVRTILTIGFGASSGILVGMQSELMDSEQREVLAGRFGLTGDEFVEMHSAPQRVHDTAITVIMLAYATEWERVLLYGEECVPELHRPIVRALLNG